MSTLGISTDLGHGEEGLDLVRDSTIMQAPGTTSADPMENSRVKLTHQGCSTWDVAEKMKAIFLLSVLDVSHLQEGNSKERISLQLRPSLKGK